MSEFFNVWRRKVGCITLVMTTLMVGAWLRSMITQDVVSWPPNTLFSAVELDSCKSVLHVSLDTNLTWESYIPFSLSWDSSPASETEMYEPDQESWLFHVFGGGLSANNNDNFLLVVPYWMIAIPTTILSAYLILWPIKRKAAA